MSDPEEGALAPASGADARLRARHFVVQALYQQQMNDTSASALAAQFLAEQDFAQADRGYFREALLAILKTRRSTHSTGRRSIDPRPALTP